MRLPPALRTFLAASAIFALLCFGTEAVCRFLLHWGKPYDSPTIQNKLRFVDFHTFFNKFAYFHSPDFFVRQGVLPYPAPALVAYKLFLIPQPTPFHGTAAIARFEGSLLLASWIMLFMFYKSLVRRGLLTRSAAALVLGTYLLSFPFWFEFVQGNVEWVVWGFLMLGIWAFCQWHMKTAALCIGIAGSMKLFPVIFLGLFLSFRQFRAALLMLLTFAASTIVSLWLVCPDIHLSWVQTLTALGLFERSYMVQVRPVEVGFDHSLFALTKLVLTAVAGTGYAQERIGIYLAVVALGGCLLFFTRIRKLPVTNQVLCLAVSAVVLPPISYDYTLIHLYAGFVLLVFLVVEDAKAGTRSKPAGLWFSLLVLTFLLSPETEFIYHGRLYGGQLKCVALLALGYASLRYPFRLKDLPLVADAP